MTPDELGAAFLTSYGESGGEASYAVENGECTVTVPRAGWPRALEVARDDLGCEAFDWLSAVDELDDGFSVWAHVWSVEETHRLLLRTLVPRDDARVATVTGVFRGAAWHERETFEMFGVDFEGHPDLKPLLLPDGFEGYPLRKEFVLAARAAKPWPGAKEPGESGEGSPSRRKMQPPGVPDPETWGPRPPGNPEPDTAPHEGTLQSNLSSEGSPQSPADPTEGSPHAVGDADG